MQKNQTMTKTYWLWSALALTLALSGCTNTPHRAPVEERSVGKSAGASKPPLQPTAEALPEGKPLPGAENAGKPGYYTVKPGDTLIRVALEAGQSWRDIAKWNGLENPNVIEVGQVLRVVQPGVDPTQVSARPVTSARVDTKPLDSRGGKPETPKESRPSTAAPSPSSPASAASPGASSDELQLVWPANGPVLAGFDEVKNRGLLFSGKAGDPVFAAADGRVVFVGVLRGYGNLVIIKHNATYLTAYGHNQSFVVKDGQAVRGGQKIAEMGSTDAEQVQLMFEVRRNGRTIDPARMLSSR
ncbi:peptidoglycan DD-metalloendopeptidase family protein [Roseateles sp. BYS180W]|uniref:Peptidoglycan DD-metalloendopeptidase family protein n=1 Tax=Roseateles rivi TaxID=3299028 RepID=A0ABW7FYE2_9BURK